MNRYSKKQLAIENENMDFIRRIPGLIELRNKARQETRLFRSTDKLTVSLSRSNCTIKTCHDDVVNVCHSLKDENAVVLNFASAYNPGGGYLKGSTAQEEVLCRASTLYNCLEGNISYSQKRSTNGLYEDNAIYSPNVPFFRNSEGVVLNKPYLMGVISMAAPNAGQARLKGVPENVIENTMYGRIRRVLEIAKYYEYDTIILGAWGCGVFGNNPKTVAQMFNYLLKYYSFKNVYFAIHDKETYDIFNSVFTDKA